MKKLKTILRYDDVSGLFLYIIFSIILLYLSFTYYLLLIAFVLYNLFLYKKNKTLFVYSVSISLLLFLIYFFNYIYIKNINVDDSITGIVIYKEDNYFLLKRNLFLIKVYKENISNIKIGDKLIIYGKELIISERNVEGTFSYYRYKLSKRILFDYKMNKYIKCDNSFNIYKLKGLIIDYIDNNFSNLSQKYLKRLILGISNFDEEKEEMISKTGIIYLYAISGLHISLLTGIIKKILTLLNVQIEIQSIFIIIFLFFYRLLAQSSVSINRSILMVSILEILGLIDKEIERIDILSISFIISLALNPFSIYQISFYLTYLSTLIIYLDKEKSFIKMSLDIIVFTIPILLYNNHQVSIFIALYSLIFSYLFSYIVIPFTYIVIFLPFLDSIYKNLLESLESVLEIFYSFNININFSISNIYFLFSIYIALFLIYKWNKNKIKKCVNIAIFFLIITMNYICSIYEFIPSLEMIDVGQGDSFLLRSGFKTILIDTGNSDEYDTTIEYLKGKNIQKIDYVFISHYDSDHYGEYEDIKNSFKIKKMVTELNDGTFYINDFFVKTYYKKLDSDNDSSMVLLVMVRNKTILFTGDIEDEGENYILANGIKNIDILKVAHHGSSSSTSNIFLDQLNPKIALISVGLNNSYGHPSDEIVERLNKRNIKIYRTDYDGTVKICFLANSYIIKKYKNNQIFYSDGISNISIIFNNMI